ncbi:MAG: hypothetical protein Q9225_006058 [Loekoesia sp. 1 TL-2023]
MSYPRGTSNPECYGRLSRSSLRDPEKANQTQYSASNGPHRSHAFSTYISEEEEDVKEHTVWILVYLSFFSPIVAAFVSIYTFLTIFLLLLLSPVLCFCKPCKPLNQQLRAFLTPTIYFQLSLAFSPVESGFDGTKPEDFDISNSGSVLLLILVNIFFPIYAAGIAVTAWVAAGFWATALILGNPDGRDGKDDGKAVVLGVRRLWERWLKRGLR